MLWKKKISFFSWLFLYLSNLTFQPTFLLSFFLFPFPSSFSLTLFPLNLFRPLSFLSFPVFPFSCSSYLILSYLILLSHIISSYLILSHIISYYLILSHIISPLLIFSFLHRERKGPTLVIAQSGCIGCDPRQWRKSIPALTVRYKKMIIIFFLLLLINFFTQQYYFNLFS